MRLPTKVENITPEWLSEALSTRTHGTSVEAIEDVNVLWGTTAKVLIRVRYSEGGNPGNIPETLCVKGGFDDALRPRVGDAYVAEANFFGQLAPKLNAPLPRCWFAHAEPEHKQGIIILDDLSKAGATFGDPLVPLSVDDVAEGLELQARWQADTWGGTPEQYPILHQGSWIRVPAVELFGEQNWQRALSEERVLSRVPERLQDRRIVYSALETMWRHDDEHGIPCLSHSDPHIGNVFIGADDRIGFMDWQSGSLAPAMDDVAYFMVGALSIDDRRRNEPALLKHYVEVLESLLKQKLSWDKVWEDYRRHCMHGFFWVVVPGEMQTADRSSAMIERYVTAIEDHDTLSLLA